MQSTNDEWTEVWAAACKLSSEYEDIVFIGGVAVFVHLSNASVDEAMLEFSHDVDACISISDYADLRDFYVATPNKRLNKTQIEIGAAEIDLYVEHANALAIPYGEIKAHRVDYDGIRVAALEHLLVLKLDAAIDRERSPKGAKDRRDIAKIGYMLGERGMQPELIRPFLTSPRKDFLQSVEKSTAFIEVTRGNAFLAKKIRSGYQHMLGAVCTPSKRRPQP